MVSYSKVFKSSSISLLDDVKVISQPLISSNLQVTEVNPLDIQPVEDSKEIQHAQQLIEEATAEAQAMIERAEEKARSLEAASSEKINQWWEENEKRLEELSLEAKQEGYQEGFAKGNHEAMLQNEQEYKGKLVQAQQLLEQAFAEKEAIISEAEPFLLELSFVIASQIVKQELDCYPDKFVESIKQHILRFKEKEFISVCVHPDDFEFIQAQRTHLVAVVNGETEIKIIPDPTVTQKGCIIRTAYGSVDARIDTQIEEIKKVILEARREP